MIDKERENLRNNVYRLNKKYPEKIQILRTCDHKGEKFRHHPDYKKPFEIEMLCFECHGKAQNHREHNSTKIISSVETLVIIKNILNRKFNHQTNCWGKL